MTSSVTMTSNRSGAASNAASAARPSENDTGSYPSRESTSAVTASNGERELRSRQVDFECAALLERALHVDRAARGGGDRIDQRQAETGALADVLRGEERFENAGERRLVHA